MNSEMAYFHLKKSRFHKKGWAPRLALRKRLKVIIRKWTVEK